MRGPAHYQATRRLQSAHGHCLDTPVLEAQENNTKTNSKIVAEVHLLIFELVHQILQFPLLVLATKMSFAS